MSQIIRYGAYLPRPRAPLGEIQSFFGRPGRPRAKALATPALDEDTLTMAYEAGVRTLVEGAPAPASLISVTQAPPFGLRKLSGTLARALGIPDARPLDIGGEGLVDDAAIVVERDDDLIRIGLVPGAVEAKGAAGAIAARKMRIEIAQHPPPVLPVVDGELRVIDADRTLAVIDDDEAGTGVDERRQVGQLDVPVGRNDDDHGVGPLNCLLRSMLNAVIRSRTADQ